MKFVKVDSTCITKEAFIITKNVIISDVNASIVNLDSINTKTKIVIALTSNLKTFFTYNLVKMSKSTIR